MPNDAPEQVVDARDSIAESNGEQILSVFADELDSRNATTQLEPYNPTGSDLRGQTFSGFNCGDNLEGTAYSGDFLTGRNETFEGGYQFDSFSYSQALEEAARSGRPVVIGIGKPG